MVDGPEFYKFCVSSGFALHPHDRILQLMTHLIALFIVPMHFTTHLILMFVETFWITNIQDCIGGKLWPVMEAGYHTIHHTSYKHNDGHYIFMDWVFGTLCEPKSSGSTTKKQI